MPTTALAGDRSRRTRNPRDITGIRYTDQLRAKQARDAAASIDIGEVRRQAYTDGLRAGVESGFTSGWTALGELLIESGVISEERLLELVNSVEPGDDPDDAPGNES
jgi:hypothetical protein